jgi:colicin import membrane protein
VKKSTPEFVRKRFYDLLDEYSELCGALGEPFDGDVDAVSDEEEEGMAADDASEEAEEVVQPKRGKKGRAAEEAEEPAPAAAHGKKRLSWEGAPAAADQGRREKRPRKELEAPAADEARGGRKDAVAKSKKAARAQQREAEEEAAQPVHEPSPKGRRGKAPGGKGAGADDAGQADGGAGKRRPEPAAQEPVGPAGAARLTVEERRGVRSRVTTLAAASMSESALTAAPTVSPRKHALTAADFFKSEVAQPGRAARSAKAPSAPSPGRSAGGGKPAAKRGAKRGAAAAEAE